MADGVGGWLGCPPPRGQGAEQIGALGGKWDLGTWGSRASAARACGLTPGALAGMVGTQGV